MLWSKATLISGLFFLAQNLFGQVLVSPIRSKQTPRTTVGGAFALSKLDYEVGDTTLEIQRKIVAGTVTSAITPSADLIGQFGFTFDTEIEDNSNLEGKGFMFGGGMRSEVFQKDKMHFMAQGFINYLMENYESSGTPKVEIEGDVLDLHLGGTVAFQVSPDLYSYAGLELVPYSDGDIKYKKPLSASFDLERDDFLNFKLGIQYETATVGVGAQVIFIGETTILFGGHAAI